MRELKIRLKSGMELNIFCERYRVERSKVTGELLAFNCDNAYGEVPVYISIGDIECITETILRESEGE